MGRRACRELARRMVVIEKDRLEGMRRAMRGLQTADKVNVKDRAKTGNEQEAE